MKLTEEKNSYLCRAEKAEKEIQELKSRLNSNGKEKEMSSNDVHNNFDEIVALKENVLRLDSERSMLQDVLSQREKKIELLEEDMRGPVPYETARFWKHFIFCRHLSSVFCHDFRITMSLSNCLPIVVFLRVYVCLSV